MRKPGSAYLVAGIVLLLLAVIFFLPLRIGRGPLDSEKVFMVGLHNSLYYLDRAKWKWVEEKHKTEHDVPTMEDLAPYLGDWTNHIARFVALGITYKITPISEMEPQSDVATLTRDLQFRAGICRLYRTGTSYCLHTGWVSPPYDTASWFRAFYINNRELLAVGLFFLAMVSLLVFVIKRVRSFMHVRSVSHEHQNA
jgi:hypothetical protein